MNKKTSFLTERRMAASRAMRSTVAFSWAKDVVGLPIKDGSGRIAFEAAGIQASF
jgi:hypothetical protein